MLNYNYNNKTRKELMKKCPEKKYKVKKNFFKIQTCKTIGNYVDEEKLKKPFLA